MEKDSSTLTDYQKSLLKELERVSINTEFPGNFTMSIDKFLRELIDLRRKVEIKCQCSECKK